METVTCLEISKFVLDESDSGVLPTSLASWNDSSLRYGLECQDSRNLYLIRVQDTPKLLHRSGANITQDTNARKDPLIPGKLVYQIHVHLQCEPYTALGAPLTEIVTWRVRKGASRPVVEQLLTKLMGIVNKIPFEEGLYKAGWGRVINLDPEIHFIVMIGWTTMEAFTTAVRNSPAGRAVLDELEVVTERQIRHMTLRQSQVQLLKMYGTRLCRRETAVLLVLWLIIYCTLYVTLHA
ncbi:hypothetical protein BC835DRAFT_322887 [Cytidiella melzeri]|nr:hypothetical protein BC835DRAFT_322887 [Cytidiella melzeri]